MESVTGHVSWKLEWPIRGWWLASFLMAGSTREGVDIRWDEWNRLWPQAVLPPLPPCQCVRTRINRRNQSRSSIGLRESPLSPWSQFNPGGLSNTGSQRPHDYPTSRELSAFSLSLSRSVSTLSFVALAGCRSCGYAARKTKSEHEQLPPKRIPRRPLNLLLVRDRAWLFFLFSRKRSYLVLKFEF